MNYSRQRNKRGAAESKRYLESEYNYVGLKYVYSTPELRKLRLELIISNVYTYCSKQHLDTMVGCSDVWT